MDHNQPASEKLADLDLHCYKTKYILVEQGTLTDRNTLTVVYTHSVQVVQRRQDGSEDFYRDWLDYQEGFGKVDGEHWLGKI